MAIKRKVTLVPIPEVDTSVSLSDLNRTFNVSPPDGLGWKLENAFRGEHNIYYIWVNGGIEYDFGYENYWTTKSDDLVNGLVGEGSKFKIDMTSSDTTKNVSGYFEPYNSYIYGGTLAWEGSGSGKTVSLEVIADATSLISGDSVVVVNNKIIPVDDNSGTNSVDLTSYTLLDSYDSGYWDIIDGVLTPNYSETGQFSMYTNDVTVARLINDIDLIPSNVGQHEIVSKNAWRVFPNYRFQLTANAISTGDWSVVLYFHMIKRKTVSY